MGNQYMMHEGFKRSLVESERAVEIVCQWLCSTGRECYVNDITVAERFPDRHAHKDDGDIRYIHPELGEQIIEVKQLSRDFTVDRFFNNRFFIVDGKTTFDNKRQRPLAYVAVNPDVTVCGIVNVPETIHLWYVKRLPDAKRSNDFGDDVHCVFYVINPRRVTWLELQ